MDLKHLPATVTIVDSVDQFELYCHSEVGYPKEKDLPDNQGYSRMMLFRTVLREREYCDRSTLFQPSSAEECKGSTFDHAATIVTTIFSFAWIH